MGTTRIVETSMERPLDILRGEFESLPGLRLTLPQVARLLALDPGEAELLLGRLEAEGLLMRDHGVAYRRSAPLLS
jgi:DNA-binding IclR family transcriptional regulator